MPSAKEREEFINLIGAQGKEPMCQREGWNACDKVIAQPLRTRLLAAEEANRKLREALEKLSAHCPSVNGQGIIREALTPSPVGKEKDV